LRKSNKEGMPKSYEDNVGKMAKRKSAEGHAHNTKMPVKNNPKT